MHSVRALILCTSAFTLATFLAGCGSTSVPSSFSGGNGNPTSQGTAPTVTAVAEQTNGVAPNRRQEVQFSEPMAANTINNQTFVVTDASGKAMPGVVSYDSDFNVASFQPNPALATGATYNVTITTGVTSAQGVPMAANYSYSFATRAATDTSPITVQVVSPAANTDCVAVSSDITVTFNEEPDASTVNAKNISITGPGGSMIPATLTMDVSKTVVTATPTSALPQGTITVTVSGVADLAGVAMTAPYTWTFSTGCNTGGGSGGGIGSGTGDTAFVYVASGETSMGTPYQINEFAAAADGTLTPIPGSPLSIAGAPDRMIANGSYLFVPESGTYVVSYAIGSSGALTAAATTNSSQDDNPTGEGGPVATFLDRTGQTVYTNSAFAYQGNSRYLTYALRAGGTLAFQGIETYGDPQDPQLSFTLNNQDAYGSDCYHFYPIFYGFTRASNGTLTYFDPKPNVPAGPTVNNQQQTSYCPDGAQVPDNNHVVIEMQEIPNGPGNPLIDQFAVYTIAADGTLSTSDTATTMPPFEAGYVNSYRFDPTGTWMAAGGTSGIELYRFTNGKLTRIDSRSVPSGVDEVAWDASGHIYALSQKGGQLWVYSVSSTGLLTPTAASPYAVPTYGFLAVQPVQ